MRLASLSLTALVYASVVWANYTDPTVLDACPGYKATAVSTHGNTLTANLALAGKGCNVYGTDIEKLKLEVTYETKARIHVKITDAAKKRYEIPESVLPRPKADASVSPQHADILFNYTTSPFSFSIVRASNKEVLFTTGKHPIIFEPQYLRLKTDLPDNANIYGLGEHTDPFRLPTFNTTRTFWSRDAYSVPVGSNLYGNHPIYFEHRTTGSHGVFFANSNGLDIKINDTDGTSLEYNAIGGVLDFYFLAGSTTDPIELVKQYAEVVGTPAEVPYWSLGFHQCRFGYQNYLDVAQVITNYSSAGIPLETMWTDIDYMYQRRIFTVDNQYFPLNRMQEIVDYLHAHDQYYILMTDPAVAYLPGGSYGPYDRGTDLDIWLKAKDGKDPNLGLVWPGVTVYPDWFHPDTQEYWTNEFKLFYDPKKGVDIDGCWIDMNDPASFCVDPCDDPFQQAIEQDLPPARITAPPNQYTDPFNTSLSTFQTPAKRAVITPAFDHSGEDLLHPPYAINNQAGAGALSDRTAWTDSLHANGLVEYDAHNLYGTMMSIATQKAMEARRPGQRTLVITRSTFAGAGSKVGKWLGDNLSDWPHYRNSIAGILGMASIYHIPMVGADICGFGDNTTETLCARWAMLGAFYPFMRDHNQDVGRPQEFYRWPTVAQAARNVLDIRYRLMDYIYTAFHQANTDGTPVLNPLWYKYPQDANTFPIDLQFLYGDSILVSPVTEENVTTVTAYFPNDTFYDFLTLEPFEGQGANVTFDDVDYTSIPLHIKGGAVLPLRQKGAMTTKLLRQTPFELVVAPNRNGTASGQLYADDGVSVTPKTTTLAKFAYKNGTLTTTGSFGHDLGVNLARVRFLNVGAAPAHVKVNAKTVGASAVTYNATNKVLDVAFNATFDRGFTVQFS
ncbi:alpha-glucosidase [Trametopsis cervina]|nr:alpha-glucosidase [Trametopsis cervina]